MVLQHSSVGNPYTGVKQVGEATIEATKVAALLKNIIMTPGCASLTFSQMLLCILDSLHGISAGIRYCLDPTTCF